MKVTVTKKPKKEPIIIEIETPFIKLQSLLKLANAVMSGGEAKQVILDGLVQLNGQVCLERGKKVQDNDLVALAQFGEIRVKCISNS